MIKEIFFISIISSFIYIFYLFSNALLSKFITKNSYEKGLKNFSNLNLKVTSLGLAFYFFYLFCSILNLLAHFFGIGISLNLYSILFLIIFVFISKKKIFNFFSFTFKYFRESFIQNVLYFLSFINYKRPIISILSLTILIQIIVIFYKLFFPITHGDQLEHYFSDAIQISRLDTLSLNDFYKLGGGLRSDSLASFFDSFIIQLSNSWLLTRLMKVFSLCLSLILSIDFMLSIKKVGYSRLILFVASIMALVDIWTLTVSGKFDIYVMALEIIAFRLVLFSSAIKDFNNKLFVIFIYLSIALVSVFTRLSSLALFSLLIIFSFFEIFNANKLNKINKLSLFKFFIFLFLFTSICGIIPIFNSLYFKNPFYTLSPPTIFSGLFPEAIFVDNYEKFKDIYNLKNIPLFLKPFLTLVYSSLGIEQIRFLLKRLSDYHYIFKSLFNFISIIGPNQIMIAIDSFSPIILLSIFFKNSNDVFGNSLKKIFYFLLLWIMLWSLGISYTRVALASSTLLTAFAIVNLNLNNNGHRIINLFKSSIFYYGVLVTFLLGIWGFTTLFDLPNLSANLFPYNKANLIKEFVDLNYSHSLKYTHSRRIVIPNSEFINYWNNLNKRSKPNILFNAPKYYVYFLKEGLVLENKYDLNKNDLKNYDGNIYELTNTSEFNLIK